MRVQSLDLRQNAILFQRFCAIWLLPDAIPAATGIPYKILSREDPKKKHLCGAEPVKKENNLAD